MTLPLAEALALALQCAPAVAPETLLSIVQVESGFRPLAIGVNGKPRVNVEVRNAAEAAARAKALIADGRSVDLGLAQINSKNLDWLGLTVEAAFEPCTNLAAAARVLQAGYEPKAELSDEQPALRRALSRYNTGDAQRGFTNGYVGKVVAVAADLVPALRAAPPASQIAGIGRSSARPRPDWDVFGEVQSGGVLIRVADTPVAAEPAR